MLLDVLPAITLIFGIYEYEWQISYTSGTLDIKGGLHPEPLFEDFCIFWK